jgi:6-phosphofructokinase
VPKTIDNDLALTDNCPGFGSVAKYVAVSTREASLDVLSMAESSTKVFVLEVMGRHAGWIAAAAGLAGSRDGDPPHLILFPEVAFDEARFLAAVKERSSATATAPSSPARACAARMASSWPRPARAMRSATCNWAVSGR